MTPVRTVKARALRQVRNAVDFATAFEHGRGAAALTTAALRCLRAGRALQRYVNRVGAVDEATAVWARALKDANGRLVELARAAGWSTAAVPQWMGLRGAEQGDVDELARELGVDE